MMTSPDLIHNLGLCAVGYGRSPHREARADDGHSAVSVSVVQFIQF